MTATLSSHILDTHLGTPAVNIEVILKRIDRNISADALSLKPLAKASTNSDGRIGIKDWQGVDGFNIESDLACGRYTLTFATQSYFETQSITMFYPEVIIDFIIGDDSHYHIPLLLSAHGYSTYRGS